MDPQNKIPGVPSNDIYYPSNWEEYTPYGYPQDNISVKKEEFDDPLPPQNLQPEKETVNPQIDQQIQSAIECYISAFMQNYSYSFEEIIHSI